MGLEINASTAAYHEMKSTQYNNFSGANAVPVEAAAAAQATQVVIESDSRGSGRESNPQTAAQQIESALLQANKRAKFGNTNAQFTYHEKTRRISIKILDKETNEVIKEIPPEETLEMISKMWELAGLLVDEKR